jgi:STE24 endopeptidase
VTERLAFRQLPTLAGVTGAWAAAAYFLWESTIPSGLSLPTLDVHRFFTQHVIDRAEHFERLLEIGWVLNEVLLVGVFVLYAVHGARFTKESAAGPIGTGILLAMLGFALVWIAQLPYQIVATWCERRYHVLKVSYVDVVLGGWLGLGAQFIALSAAVAIVMGAARFLPRGWWLVAVPVFAAIQLLLTFVSPYLVPSHALHDPQLAAEAKRLERQEGLSGIPVVVQDVHDYTPEENAFAAGLGPSRKVFLWDTLLTNGLRERELRVVLAHEFGHHARYHLWKELGWFALFAFPEAYLVAQATRRRGGLRNPESIPLALLVVTAFALAATPVENVISRHYEAEADWQALRTTRDPAAATRLFQHFGSSDISNPDPPTWAYVLFENHPTLMQRIAMAEAWKARNR